MSSYSLKRPVLCTLEKKIVNATPTKNKIEKRNLGKSSVEVSKVGIGAWSWGDRSGYWGYGREYGKTESYEAYKEAIKNDITFIDTAEVYGYGKSEEFLGEFMKETNTTASVATKYAPLPWRLTKESVPIALESSLKRLQLNKIDLYMIHWPGFLTNYFSNDAYVNGLAKCVELGLTNAIGVSNFNKDRIRRAHKLLEEQGIPLASNQVQYSLLYRKPETNGVKEICDELGITLVAYCPLGQGLLTGKYTPDNLPTGPRGISINAQRIKSVESLIDLMKAIGKEHNDKTPAQVAINWTICKGTLPIPGVKTVAQVNEVVGSIGWQLNDAEVSELDSLSSKIDSASGAPFENW